MENFPCIQFVKFLNTYLLALKNASAKPGGVMLLSSFVFALFPPVDIIISL